MSVLKPLFLEEENLKWIEKIITKRGGIMYKAKEDAPYKIKKSVKDWNDMFKRADKLGKIL